jgi:menaquinone-dependent protoporphyrinogen oxidase
VKNRVLITYATRAGSTVEIAAEVGKNLCEHGFSVDVNPVENAPSLEDYQVVIMGSAIRMGSWLPEAVAFVEENKATLNTKPVALFSVHMLNTGDDEVSRTNRMAYLDKVRPLLKDPEEVYFQGEMDFSHLSILDRMIAKMVKAVEADKRDWESIRSWVPEILN